MMGGIEDWQMCGCGFVARYFVDFSMNVHEANSSGDFSRKNHYVSCFGDFSRNNH
jgi:hypothetical protein